MADIIGLDASNAKPGEKSPFARLAPKDRKPWERSLPEFLDLAVRRDPDKVFVEISGEKITYQEFQRRAFEVAAIFRSLGVGYRDRVCLFLPNCAEFLYCWFGLSTIGAISVPINTAYKRDEMAYILNDAEACALVAHESLLSVAAEAAKLAPSLKHKLLVGNPPSPPLRKGGLKDSPLPEDDRGNPSLLREQESPPLVKRGLGGFPEGSQEGPPLDGWLTFTQAMPQSAFSVMFHPVSPQDISMLVYTSGTTGNPKGVQVTHQMYVAAGQGFAHWTQATSEDQFFTCLPYFHANAQYYSTMGTLAAGATLVVVDRFSASRFWQQVREARATVVNFIGMMMPVLAKQPESPTDRENQVRLFYGSPAFSPEFLQAFQERFGTDIIVGFGMTETCYATIERIGQERRANSSGLPRQHPDPSFVNQIRIVDDAGNSVSPNTVGEITINNPAVMPGYWRNEEQTRQALRDGWLSTGDLGWLDEDGFLYFVDRKKDVIRRRGENISSQEVEDVIKRHPSVLDCAIIAVPSELGEDEVKAYIMPRPGAALEPKEIIFWCAERLAYFKVPRYIEMRDELPRTPSLRVRKDVLRQERPDLIEGCFDREKAGIRLR
jgi:crotonobetaine/carnitine-CoA ligase